LNLRDFTQDAVEAGNKLLEADHARRITRKAMVTMVANVMLSPKAALGHENFAPSCDDR